MKDLFDHARDQRKNGFAPLADRIRPRRFEDLLGQDDLVGVDKPLRLLIDRDQVPSLIFWGPPGTGKTTLAKLIADRTRAVFAELSAVMSGVADIRRVIKEADERQKFHAQRTILFIDEIHRFSKSQQDALLPSVEHGVLTLIGATTENPSFEVISALLSRCRICVLSRISEDGIRQIIETALVDRERGLGAMSIFMEEEVKNELVVLADGDARMALNALELAVASAPKNKQERIVVTLGHVRSALQRTHILYDKGGDEHYNIISALHKSMRGSDANAALYWLGRMVEGGEDPLYIARRLIRFASEDIGMADPSALNQAVAAYQACHVIGVPECNVILAQAVVYLSEAPKSNALYLAYGNVQEDIRRLPNEPVPLVIRNAPTKLMKNLGYGKDYIYPPNVKSPVKQEYLPEHLKDRTYWDRRS